MGGGTVNHAGVITEERKGQMEQWLTSDEVAALEGWSYECLKKKWQRDQIPYRKNGRLEIPLSALSTQAQELYYGIHGRPEPHAPLQDLSEEKRRELSRRIDLIKHAPRKNPQALAQYLKDNNIPQSTYYDWKKKYKESKAEGLLDKRGGSTRQISPQDQAVLARLYLRPSSPTIQEVYRQFLALRETENRRQNTEYRSRVGYAHQNTPPAPLNRGEDTPPAPLNRGENTPLPTIHQVRGFLDALPEPTKLRYRHGVEAYKNFSEIFAERDYASIIPGEIWTSDHTQIDVAVRDPLSGRAAFPWITIIMDVRSRKITGYFLGETPSGRTIAAALGRALKTHQPPKRAILDNGMDYRSRYISGGQLRLKKGKLEVAEETKGLLTTLNIDVQWCIVKNAQAKPCERWFRRLKEEFLRRLPGYRGGRIWERPEGLAKEMKSGQLLSFVELDKLLGGWIEEYNSSPHQGQAMEGKTPNQAYDTPPTPLNRGEIKLINPDTLTLLMMPFARRRIYRNGIKFLGEVYYAPALEALRGHQVDIRWDPQEIGRLAVLDLQGAFICWALHQQRLSFNASEEDVKALMQKKRSQRRLHEDYYQNLTEQIEDPDLLRRVITARRVPEGGLSAAKPALHQDGAGPAGRLHHPQDAQALQMKVTKELPAWGQMTADRGGKKKRIFFEEEEEA